VLLQQRLVVSGARTSIVSSISFRITCNTLRRAGSRDFGRTLSRQLIHLIFGPLAVTTTCAPGSSAFQVSLDWLAACCNKATTRPPGLIGRRCRHVGRSWCKFRGLLLGVGHVVIEASTSQLSKNEST